MGRNKGRNNYESYCWRYIVCERKREKGRGEKRRGEQRTWKEYMQKNMKWEEVDGLRKGELKK